MIVRYDLERQPHSIGDVMHMAVGAMTLGEPIEFNFCKCGDDMKFALSPLNEAPRMSPAVERVLITRGICAKFDFPTIDYYAFYWLNDEVLLPYFEKTGSVPHLTTQKKKDGISVSVNLRDNKSVSPKRNSNVAAWKQFFKAHPEEQFSLVGDVAIEMPNVRYFDGKRGGLLENLSIIENSAFHMGTISGPCELVRFNDKPYAVFGPMKEDVRLKSYLDGNRWAWANPGQRWLKQDETFENIEREYLAWKSS